MDTEDVNVRTVNLHLDAAGSISLKTDINNLYARAGGSITIHDVGSLTLQDVRGGLNTLDDVNIEAFGDIIVVYVSDPVRITLTSDNGSINGVSSPSIVSYYVILNALNGDVGSLGNYLVISASDITATAGGDIYIESLGSVLFHDITGNNINLIANGSSRYQNIVAVLNIIVNQAAGDMTLVGNAMEAQNGGIDITIADGSIFTIGAGPHIKAASDSAIHLAGGVIGTIINPLDVDITGVLALDMPNAGNIDGVCGVLTGTVTGIGGPVVTGPGWPLLINVSTNHLYGTTPLAPSGFVYFNTTLIWPEIPMDYMLLVEELTRARENAIYEVMKNFTQVTMVNPHIQYFYFYHPLTPIDQGAFDGISLNAGAYEFIENSLTLDLKNKNLSSYYSV